MSFGVVTRKSVACEGTGLEEVLYELKIGHGAAGQEDLGWQGNGTCTGQVSLSSLAGTVVERCSASLCAGERKRECGSAVVRGIRPCLCRL